MMNHEKEDFEQLLPGDNHYKAYVGPPLKYDLIGAMQFNLLTSFGLRDYHKLLDIGCGSLRSGKLFIPYLRKGNYYGIEPNQWLIDEGIKYELGEEILKVKTPVFSNSDHFDLKSFGQTFDFMIAQSIFSHASASQIRQCLKEVKNTLSKDGFFLATFILGDHNYEGNDWVYPGIVAFRHDFIIKTIQEHQLVGIRSEWRHPNGQTWYIMCHPENKQELIEKEKNIFEFYKSKPEQENNLSKHSNSLFGKALHKIFRK